MTEKILIIDDDESLRWVLQRTFEKLGHSVSTAVNGEEGLSLLNEGEYALAFVDIMMPDMSGLDLLRQAKKEDCIHTAFVVMTAQNTMKNAVEAMKCGAYDYITKPFDIKEVESIAAKALESGNLSRDVLKKKKSPKKRYEVGKELLGESPLMQKVYKTIGKVSQSDVTVLIQGESGTGKELIAKAIHHNSERVDRPFVAINAAAIPRDLLESELFGHEKGAFTGAIEKKLGKFELAEGGTLFLDEIGDMSPDLQMKLLRALQEREVDRVGGKTPIPIDVRVIAATNKSLSASVRDGLFREDLYYRLNVVNIKLPPLRKRKEDIPLLASCFLDRFSEELGRERHYITDEGMQLLVNYSWPGNVRELENSIRRMIVLAASPTILPADFPSNIREASGADKVSFDTMTLDEIMRIKLGPVIDAVDAENTTEIYSMVLAQVERPLLRLVLEKCRWNQVKAARVLGINRNTLKKKIDLLNICKTGK
ncbi:MAG: sigma-54-dependent Fis family transcriptional regulator [Proteobacteria bacterium]|nr:sigma-54-dependent Fis family transcriptional regulator [Pseudomonadota bacterium]